MKLNKILFLKFNKIDIEDIKCVINIDFPNQHEDYIHRIGRTARSQNTGTAYTLVTSSNANKVPKLLEILRESNQEISRNLLDLSKRHENGQIANNNNGRRNYSKFLLIL